MGKESSELNVGTTWVVVADSSRADFFIRRKRFGPLEPLKSLTTPDARALEQDFNADKPGRSYDSKGAGRHAMEPDHTVKEHVRENFARRIADELDKGRVANEYLHLVIVAAPKLLGEIREKLSDPTRQLVTVEIDKELTGQDLSVIRAEVDEQS